jgi:hypothetical protein
MAGMDEKDSRDAAPQSIVTRARQKYIPAQTRTGRRRSLVEPNEQTST